MCNYESLLYNIMSICSGSGRDSRWLFVMYLLNNLVIFFQGAKQYRRILHRSDICASVILGYDEIRERGRQWFPAGPDDLPDPWPICSAGAHWTAQGTSWCSLFSVPFAEARQVPLDASALNRCHHCRHFQTLLFDRQSREFASDEPDTLPFLLGANCMDRLVEKFSGLKNNSGWFEQFLRFLRLD